MTLMWCMMLSGRRRRHLKVVVGRLRMLTLKPTDCYAVSQLS